MNTAGKQSPASLGMNESFLQALLKEQDMKKTQKRKEFVYPRGGTEIHSFLDLLDHSPKFHFRMIIPLT